MLFVVWGHAIFDAYFLESVTELRVSFSELLRHCWSCSGENAAFVYVNTGNFS